MKSLTTFHIRWASSLLALAFSCAPPLEHAAFAQSTSAPAAQSRCANCGVVENVREVERKGGSSGVGAVAGGVLGGVLGHQIGSGRGNTVATIAGAGAGAYAGNEIEKNRNKRTYWSVVVRTDNGRTRTYSYKNPPDLREGDRVKLLDGGKRIALVAP